MLTDMQIDAETTQTARDEEFMRLALMQAKISDRTAGTERIGCVIVMDDKVVAVGFNQVALLSDPTAHAEIVTLRHLGHALRRHEFHGATLYTTLEPCGMCTMASIWAKVSRIVYGAGRHDVHSMYFEDKHLHTMDFVRDAFRDDMVVTGGVLREACAALYTPPDAAVPLAQQANQ